MKRHLMTLLLVGILASLVSASMSRNSAAGQERGVGVPTFEADPTWPKVPAKWKLGDVSSVAIDEQDNVWVLHRPRTLPPQDMALAAPPILEFDSTGKFLQAWGGAATGYEWPEREHGIYVDHKGYIWIGGNNCAARQLPGLQGC